MRIARWLRPVLGAGAVGALGALALAFAPTPVAGRVLAADGTPLRGVAVLVGGHATLTDAAGRYRFLAVSRRFREVQINTRGFVPVVVPLPAARLSAWRDLTLRLERSPRIAGRVVNEGGQPLPKAHILAFAPSRWTDEQLPDEAVADDDGNFSFDGLPVGPLALMVDSPGYVQGEDQLTLRPGMVLQTVERLERERGLLRIVTDPAGADVTVAGLPARCTSPCELRLESGPQHLTLTAPRYVPLEVDAAVVYKQVTEVAPRLERMRGHLRVNAPDGAAVFLNGERVGEAPWEADVPTDLYSVEVKAAGRWPARASTEVKWRETSAVELAPPAFGHRPARGAWVAGLEAYLANLGGRYGVAVLDPDGATFGTRMDELFTAASVIKLPIALYAYHEVEGERLKLDDQWEMRAEDVSDGTGVLRYQPVGTKFSVRQLLDVLIRQSDNTAAEMFRRVLGSDKIDAYMAELGAPNTRQLSVTTPREMLSLLALLWRGQILKEENREELLTFLKTTAFNDRIPAGIPAGVPVAHKIGMYGSAVNDVGIVYAGRPYVLCVFTDTADWDGAVATIRQISAGLYAFEE